MKKTRTSAKPPTPLPTATPAAAAPLRFATYVRVSTEGQGDDGHSLDVQRQTASEVVKREGGVLVTEYGGVESAMGRKQRPEFERLLRDAAARPRKFDALIVASEDRASRNASDMERLGDALADNGLRLFVDRREQDPANMLQAVIGSAFSRQESRKRHAASIRSRLLKALTKDWPSSGTLPFGRSWGRETGWQVDEKARRYIERAARQYLRGGTWEDVAARVTWPADDASVPLHRRANTVRRRVLAAGGGWEQRFALRYGVDVRDFGETAVGERLTFEDGEEGKVAVVATPVPALLDEATIAQVAARGEGKYLDRRGCTTHALSRFIRCLNCGSAINLHTHADGSVYMTHHSKTRREGCPKGLGNYRPLETRVLGALSTMLRDQKVLARAVEAAKRANMPERDDLQHERANLQEQQRKDNRALSTADTAMDSQLGEALNAAALNAIGERIAKLKAKTAASERRIAEIDERLKELAVDDAQVATVQSLMATRYPLLMAAARNPRFDEDETPTDRRRNASKLIPAKPESVEKVRRVLKALFGGASLRNRPSNTKRPTPDVGIFIGRAESDGEAVLRWVARGRFFETTGWTGSDALDSTLTWTTGAADESALVDALGGNAVVERPTYWGKASTTTARGKRPSAAVDALSTRSTRAKSSSMRWPAMLRP